jgi:hypothetical protein
MYRCVMLQESSSVASASGTSGHQTDSLNTASASSDGMYELTNNIVLVVTNTIISLVQTRVLNRLIEPL